MVDSTYSPLFSDLTNIMVVVAIVVVIVLVMIMYKLSRIKPAHNHRDEE